MKRSLLIFTALTLASCSSMYREPESIEEKMERYTSREIIINQIPEFSVSEFKTKGTRTPASANKKSEVNITNKRLYFISLYDQYSSFTQIFPEYKKTLEYCPVFHQTLLSYKDNDKKWNWIKNIDETNTPNILSSLPGEDTKEKIGLHMERNFHEIEKLCITGASNNYYIYENMVTLSKNGKFKGRTKSSINTMYKTSIFFNHSLLTKIGKRVKAKKSGRGLASANDKTDYENEALNRMNASWAKNY